MPVKATSTEVYSGKNLFNSYVVPNYTLSVGTITVDSDGIISMSGNTRSNGYCRIYTSFSDFVPSLVAGQTYYIYVNNEFDPGNRNYIYLYGSSFFWNSGQPHTVTQAELDANIVLYGGYQATTKMTIMVTTTPDASYEPYVGGVPSPLISGVTHVSTSKNMLNMQSDSNGEYLGTMSQGGYSAKNLYIGSPSFAGYGNVSGWEDGGTYNGMPVVKKAGSWGGAFKLVNIVAGKTYTFSAWIKSDQARSVAIYATGGSTGATATISPGNKQITTSTDWERVSFTFTCSASGSIALRFENTTSSDTNYTYISGYQLELGPDATSYERYIGDGIYSGKNLLNITGKTSYGVTGTINNDGTITLTGTASVSSGVDVAGNQSPNLLAGTYTFTIGQPRTGIVNLIVNYSGGYAAARIAAGDTSATITIPSNATNCTLFVAVTNGVTYNETFQLQLVSGSTPDYNFEPYVGGIPSPSPNYPQEIVTGKLASKNLFALGKTNRTIADVSYTYNSDGTFSLSGTASAGTGAKSGPIPIAESGLIPGQKYSFWCDHNIGWGSNSCVYYAQSCDSSGNWTGNLMTFTQNGGTATMPSTTTQYVMFVAAISNGSSYSSYNNVKAQLVAGEQVDSMFEPYFTPIELTQIGSYQDKVYKSGGNWRIETRNSKMLLDGSQTWTVGTGTNAYWTALAGSNDYNPIQTTMSDQFVGIAYNDRGNTPPNIMYRDNQTLTIRNTSFASASAATSWFTSNPATVYYLLATPTDTAITDSATIAWLNKYDTDSLPHHKYVNTRRTTYVGASGLASAIDLYDGSYASTLPTYSTANDHHLTTANGGTYTVSLQNISAKIVSGTVTFSVFTNQRKIDFSWNGSATSTNVSVSLQADEYIKSIYAYIPQNADAGITLSQQLESGSLTDFEPYYNIVKIYAGDDLVFEDTSLTD